MCARFVAWGTCLKNPSMTEHMPQRHPNLRRRLLLTLLGPMLLLLVIDAIVTYSVALNYADRVHDADIGDDLLTLAQKFRSGEVPGDLPREVRLLIEYDNDGHSYYAIHSTRRGLLGGLSGLVRSDVIPDLPPELRDVELGGRTLRVATLGLNSPNDPDDIISISIAETLRGRQSRAWQILMLIIPLQTGLIIAAVSLVWLGVTRGLRILEPLTQRLARRDEQLEPITAIDVPVEILPLTQTIDGLFARLRSVLALQERFVADAAHQLHTPLTGLRLHVDRALASSNPQVVRDALHYIDQLTERCTRTSTQLLALARAQGQQEEHLFTEVVDLADLVPEIVERRIPEALRAHIDLGYQGPEEQALVHADPGALQEMLDNLIDNVLRYAGRDANATVSVMLPSNTSVLLQVEDDGPGVPVEMLDRLDERFFRVPDTPVPGTGLGLAIVQEIARRHGASCKLTTSAGGGLQVNVLFPRLEPF